MKKFFWMAGMILLAASCSNECVDMVDNGRMETTVAPVRVHVDDFAVSMAAFSIAHVFSGVLMGQSASAVLLSFLTYLPFGFALAWVFERCSGRGAARETAIGILPTVEAIDLDGLEGKVSKVDLEQLLEVDIAGWKNELAMIKEHYAKFGSHLPAELSKQLEGLESRLG